MGNSTVEDILDAAEGLFAERGFVETSLRTITSTAGVNLAAVNYHFGSKNDLIQAVFSRFLKPIWGHVDSEMSSEKGQFTSIEQLLTLLIRSVLKGTVDRPNGAERFTKLLGLAYTQSQGHLRRFIVEQYGQEYKRFTEKLRSVAPEMSPLDFYLRLYFIMGAAVFTLSSFEAIQDIIRSDFDVDTTVVDVMNRFVPVAAAMLDVNLNKN